MVLVLVYWNTVVYHESGKNQAWSRSIRHKEKQIRWWNLQDITVIAAQTAKPKFNISCFPLFPYLCPYIDQHLGTELWYLTELAIKGKKHPRMHQKQKQTSSRQKSAAEQKDNFVNFLNKRVFQRPPFSWMWATVTPETQSVVLTASHYTCCKLWIL